MKVLTNYVRLGLVGPEQCDVRGGNTHSVTRVAPALQVHMAAAQNLLDKQLASRGRDAR